MDNKQIAETILRQLAPSMRGLVLMIGARDFVAVERGVQFRIGSGAKSRINKVRITLDWRDTYTMEFWHVKGATAKLVSEASHVYADQMAEIFESHTGFFLNLRPRRSA